MPWLAHYSAAMRAPVRPPETVLHAFLDAVRRVPDRTALAYFDGRLSYAEVDRLSDGVAGHLARRGFGRGDRLALMLQNTPHFVIALLGAWKAGGVVVPVNPMYKEREVGHVLADAEVTALVCEDRAWAGHLRGVAAGSAVRVVLTARPHDFQTRDDPRVLPRERPEPAADADDLLAVARAGADDRTSAGTDGRTSAGSRTGAEADRRTGTGSRTGSGAGSRTGSGAGSRTGAAPAPVPLRSSDLALISYTSGTSGLPKGAMNTHGSIAFSAEAQRQGSELDDGAGVFVLAPLFHITGMVCELAACVLNAGTLALAYRFEPGVVLDAFLEHRPHFTAGPATAYVALSAHPGATREHFASFRVLGSGGAAVPAALVERFGAEFGPYLRQGYGLTECSGACASVPPGLRAPVDPVTGALSVGLPTPGARIRVLDDEGAEVPLGERGEIAVAGPLVVPGYWRQPEATAATFPGGELRTGDIGFMDPDGWLYVVDRKKDMINASGFKVWPREVEDVLYTHPAVREAAVVGVPDAYRGETVKAYVSLRPGRGAEPEELVAHCAQRLAAYKYPRVVEILPELPKTSSGKILRRELRPRDPAGGT
ncbi:AMP-binding protein [Streptomyces sp. URMC 123]|uniref:AMP-binding protein n=1 Tax=Streptomyces sp. URMC 123 TaxID=3423403 RepID=UPI003F1D7F22